MSEAAANSDERFYESAEYDDATLRWGIAKAGKFFEGWKHRVQGRAPSGLRILDLGSGTCALPTLLSRLECVSSITATDISVKRMEKNAQRAAQIAGGTLAKLSFERLDFNTPFPFSDGAFDLVTADAALHHSRSLWFTLFEVNRVLTPDGVFAAQREAFLATLSSHVAMRRLLDSPEFAAGVSENAFLKSQYDYYLKAAGFAPVFDSWIPEVKFRLARPLNGIAFARYLIWAPKVSPPRYTLG